LESSGLMNEMSQRLQSDLKLAGEYLAAHVDYEAARKALAAILKLDVPEISGITAGGMPDRVKCLHSLVAHSLAVGTGVNPLGDEALAALNPWWLSKPCSVIENLINEEQ